VTGNLGRTVTLGRVAGISVRAHWSVLVIFALVTQVLALSILPEAVEGTSPQTAWVTGVTVAGLFLVTLLAHEVAHALVATHHGIEVKSITLWTLGGVTELEGEPPDPRADLRIALVGPAVSGACAVASGLVAVALGALGAPGVMTAGVVWLAATNVLLAVFNLLPGAPLDGGRVLRAVIWRRTGDRERGELAATRAGRVTGYVFVWLGTLQLLLTTNVLGGLWVMLIGWFLASAATAELQMETTGHALAGVRVGDVMDADVTTLPAWQHLRTAALRAVDSGGEHFAVCDLEGRVVGIVAVDPLVRAAQTRPESATVASVMTPIGPRRIVTRDMELMAALRHAQVAGPLVVVEDGILIGLVTPARLNQAVRRGLLAARG
jgi:Zn-dependent protease